MASFFTDFFKAQLVASQTIMDSRPIKLVFFRYAPSMESIAPQWRTVKTVAELVAQPGWVQVGGIDGYPLSNTLTVGTRVVGGSKYVIYTEYPFSGLLEPAEVAAIGVVYVGTLAGTVDPLIFVTNTPTEGFTNIYPGDKMTSAPDPALGGASDRWLFGWATGSPDPIEGYLQLVRDAPPFEVSGSQHAWLLPQRANMIANPSFEKPGTDFWSTNGALTRVTGGAPGGGAWAGSVATPAAGYLTPTVGTVSTPDPGPPPSQFVLVAKVLGPTTATGTLASQQQNTGQHSFRIYRNSTDHRLGMVPSPDGTTVGTNYFVVGPTYAASDQYVALAVNRAVASLTAWSSTDGAAWTQGLTASGAAMAVFDSSEAVRVGAYGAGASLAVWNGRIYSVEMRTGLDPNVGGNTMAVPGAFSFPGVGANYLSVPDAAPLNITSDITLVAGIEPAVLTTGAGAFILSKGASGQVNGCSYQLLLTPSGNNHVLQLLIDTPTGLITHDSPTLQSLPTPLARRRYAVSLDCNNDVGGRVVQWLYSNDRGKTWTAWTAPATTAGTTSIKSLAQSLFIGGRSAGTNIFNGAISYVSIRSGIGGPGTVGGTEVFRYDSFTDLSPAISTDSATVTSWSGHVLTVNRAATDPKTLIVPTTAGIIWKFDANDYVSGTSYTDPRGAVWTVAAGSITAKSGEGATAGYCIMESNTFPTRMGEFDAEQWTVQAMVKGTGRVKVGLVYWDVEYRQTAVDWGQPSEVYTLSPTAWTHIATHRHAPEAHIAMVRIESQGASLQVDRVLAERGYLKDWLYFDGDDHYGARDDFSWYGGYNRAGASYSIWYNHRRALTGRMFARTVDPNDPTLNVTDENMEEQGLVYRWVPAGITVVPHLDVFYPHDLQNEVPPKAAGIVPYRTTTTDGVINPWL